MFANLYQWLENSFDVINIKIDSFTEFFQKDFLLHIFFNLIEDWKLSTEVSFLFSNSLTNKELFVSIVFLNISWLTRPKENPAFQFSLPNNNEGYSHTWLEELIINKAPSGRAL